MLAKVRARTAARYVAPGGVAARAPAGSRGGALRSAQQGASSCCRQRATVAIYICASHGPGTRP
eukprot:9375457-Lingulodinium_polyedra.AAC.1